MSSHHPLDAVKSARIKGSAFREFLRFYERTYGQEQLQTRASKLPYALRDTIEPGAPVLGVLASAWYPASSVHVLLDLLLQGMSPAEKTSLAMRASEHVMQTTLRGVYRLLFEWMATPERYARYAPKLWGTYYDSGVLEVLPQLNGNGAVSVVRAWAAHHPFICELNRGASIAIYTAMGLSHVECERLSCVSEGDVECRFITHYRAL